MNQKLISFFLYEDCPNGDVTTMAIFANNHKIAKAVFLSKQNMVVSGFSIVKDIINTKFPKLKLRVLKRDAMPVKKGMILAKIQGPIDDILKAERICLNFLQHLSGIATLTDKFVAMAKKHRVQILDTRKTIPGLRDLEKKAVRDGGGKNHRMNLSDQYLIKDNHIDAAGSVTAALQLVKKHQNQTKHKKRVEVEIRNFSEFKEALALKPDIILLDNLSPLMIRKMVALRNHVFGRGHKPYLEISGGITLKNIQKYLKLGVERISIGSLTHSAPAVDISLRVYGK